MVTFQIGTGITTYDCDASIVGEGTHFNLGSKVYALYRMESCVPVPEGDFIWYEWDGNNWVEALRYHNPSGYYGYAYCWCSNPNAASKFKVTFQSRTKEYTQTLPKACNYLQQPAGSTSINVGDYVAVRLGVENCGAASGNFYAKIFKNGIRCAGKWNEILEPSSVLKLYGSECDISAMPNSTVTIQYAGGHAEGGSWKEDFRDTITLTPVISICDQPVTVVDEDGVKIDDARVDCYEGGAFKAHCTTYYGECLLSFLDMGTQYKAVASKAGYECLDCEKYFTACTSTTFPGITLSLKKLPITCNQSFIVKDTDGNTIYSNCIIVVREGGAWINECATGTSGTCTVGLAEGKYLRACIEQLPSGYELISDSCKNFTACTSTITLKLQKSCTCGSWVKGDCISETHRRYTRTCTPSGCDAELEDRLDPSCATPTCSQQFVLQDKDTHLYITGASVKVGGVECTEYPSIERYQIDNLTIGSPYNAIASKAGYECPDTLCETTFTADPTNPAYNLYLKETPTVDNYDIVFCVGKSIWGFDWIANNFVSKVLPKITSALNATGISGLVVHGEASYYDAEKKQIVVNADIPSHSPIAPLVLWLILTLVLPALIALGIFVKDKFIDKKDAPPTVVTLRTVDLDGNPITQAITLMVKGESKTTVGGEVSFSTPNEPFLVVCTHEDYALDDPTKLYELTTVRQDVYLKSSKIRDEVTTVVDAEGNPIPGAEITLLDESGNLIGTFTADENGVITLKISSNKTQKIVVNEQNIPTGIEWIEPGTESGTETITTPSGYAMTVYAREQGTYVYIEGATITVNGKTGITVGRDGVQITELEDKDYTITAQHDSYNNGAPVTYPVPVNPAQMVEIIIIDMEHTGEDTTVRVIPRYGTQNLAGAAVTLSTREEKITTQIGYVEYGSVPYGTYTVTVVKKDFTQKEPSKEYPVRESDKIDGLVTLVVEMESTIVPPPPPPKLSMLLIYGVATVGLYVAGIFVPKVGKVVQVSAIIPGCLLIYEGYKYASAKIPFISTELEELSLPKELYEPLKGKKLISRIE